MKTPRQLKRPGSLQAYDRSLVRLRGSAAATNFALSDYRTDLADYHKMQQVSLLPIDGAIVILTCHGAWLWAIRGNLWLHFVRIAVVFPAECPGLHEC